MAVYEVSAFGVSTTRLMGGLRRGAANVRLRISVFYVSGFLARVLSPLFCTEFPV